MQFVPVHAFKPQHVGSRHIIRLLAVIQAFHARDAWIAKMNGQCVKIRIFHKIPRLHLIQLTVIGQVSYGFQRFPLFCPLPVGIFDLHPIDGDAAAQGDLANQLAIIAFKGGQLANVPGLIAIVQGLQLALDQAALAVVVGLVQDQHLPLDQLPARLLARIKNQHAQTRSMRFLRQ
ncbi:hypothetical protein D3C81_1408870 [compost metagenome]